MTGKERVAASGRATAGLMGGPTPLHPADRLGAALGLPAGALWVKRDDLTPLAGGGNKVRKLDYLCADAIARGADLLLTGGGPQSNHVRLTAAAARRLGLDCHVVLAGDSPPRASGNLVIDALLGPTVAWAGAGGLAIVAQALADTEAQLRREGRRVYAIPIGGADAVRSQGYLTAAAELTGACPDLALVVVPAGSGGTQAGLAAGLGSHELVLGVNVGAFPDVSTRIYALAGRTADLADRPRPAGTPRVDERYTASGYGAELPEVLAAMRLAARTEGLILDPIYTGKALAGLAAGLREGSLSLEGPVVFVHCGGAYGLLSDRYSQWVAGETTPK